MDNDFATGYALGVDSNSGGGGNSGGWGNGGFGDWITILLLFVLMGNGGFGWGGGYGGSGGAGLQGMATRADINEGFALNNITGGIQAIQQGICDSTYALNNAITSGFGQTQMSMMQGFNGVERGFCSLGQQLADCCCENRAAIAQVRYDMATQACDTRNLIQNTTRDLIDNQNANTRAILDFMTQDKIASLQAENQNLKLAASQAAQNSYLAAMSEAQTAELIRRINPTPVPSYQVPAPYPYCGQQTACGCGC